MSHFKGAKNGRERAKYWLGGIVDERKGDVIDERRNSRTLRGGYAPYRKPEEPVDAPVPSAPPSTNISGSKKR